MAAQLLSPRMNAGSFSRDLVNKPTAMFRTS
jgi:hypothetical protein